MKKIYFLLVALVATFCSQTASAAVTLSGPDSVTFYDGKNYFHAGQTIDREIDYLSVGCPEGYILNHVAVNGSTVYSYKTAAKVINGYAWESYKFSEPISSMDVSIKLLSTVQTATYTVKSDKDFWYINYSNTFSSLDTYNTVKTGEKVHKFVPERDSLRLSYSWYTDYYNITRNGELITLKPEHHTDWGIIVPVEDGDVFEIVTEVPDKMCRVSFVSPNGEKGFVTDFHYIVYDENSRPVYTYLDDADSYDVPAGTIIDFNWNYDEFKEPITDDGEAYKGVLNGKEVEFDFSDNFSIPVDRENIVVSFLAERHDPIDLQLDIDDASNVIIKSGDNILKLQDGLQTITIMEHHGLYIYPTSGSILKSVIADGKEYVDERQSYTAPGFYELIYPDVCKRLTGGTEKDIITVRTEKRERTIPVKVFVDGCNGTARLYTDSYVDSPYYFGIAEGENSLMMHIDDLYDLKVSFTDDNTVADVYAYPKSGSMHNNTYTLKVYQDDNLEYEVIRIYGGYPAFHSVNVTSEFDDTDYTLRKDYHAVISGKSHYLPHGTIFHINMAGENNADVYVNGSKLASASPLSHSFVVTEPSDVEIRKSTTGIENVDIDSNETPVYYNLQGVRVDSPSNGIYIEVRNGKATRRYIR